jgi:hypothetical protein
MINVIPVFVWMLVILALPHGALENAAMAGLLVTGAIVLWRVAKPSRNPYALPCGHTHGAHWNKRLVSWQCNVCPALFDLNPLRKKGE